jgi:hypothetical protein
MTTKTQQLRAANPARYAVKDARNSILRRVYGQMVGGNRLIPDYETVGDWTEAYNFVKATLDLTGWSQVRKAEVAADMQRLNPKNTPVVVVAEAA